MQIVNVFRDLFIRYLNDQAFERQPKELYEPIDYIMQMGGKRLRPVLVLLGHHLFEENVDRSLPVAYAVEMFHNFSLVHDDIMDEAMIRRTKPTVHKKFGVNTGILAGDVMLVYVYHYLSKVEDRTKLSTLMELFNDVAIRVCEGQQLDMNFETLDQIQLEEYIKMIEMKTAVLIGGAVSMGATVAGAKERDVFHLSQFGRAMGIAFQLQDDLLDAYGNSGKIWQESGRGYPAEQENFPGDQGHGNSRLFYQSQVKRLLERSRHGARPEDRKCTLHLQRIENSRISPNGKACLPGKGNDAPGKGRGTRFQKRSDGKIST